MQQRYGWRIDPSWIVFIPGVVPGLHLAARHLVPADGHALIPRPVYHHLRKRHGTRAARFQRSAAGAASGAMGLGRRCPEERLGAKTRLFFLCNPQNPGGTVFRRAELERLAEVTHDLLIVSDEIHCDLVLDAGHAARADRQPLARGLAPHGHADVAEQDLQHSRPRGCALGDHRRCCFASESFQVKRHAHVLGSPSVFGTRRRSRRYARLRRLARGAARLPARQPRLWSREDAIGLQMAHVEATYLAWIDCLGPGRRRSGRAIF